MAQNRQAPAYQEYAASMLANVQFRMLSLAERGLLYTMRLECWVNHGLPENPMTLAKVIGFDATEVSQALPAVMPFFKSQDGMISCPELDDYRAHLLGIRERQSAGGKLGAEQTNGKRTSSRQRNSGNPSGNPSGNSQVEPRVLSSVQPSSVQPNKTQSVENGSINEATPDDFITQYNHHDRANGGAGA